MKGETHLRFAASYHCVEWGILFNEKEIRIFNFSKQGDQSSYHWPDLDGIIQNEKTDEFFKI